MQLTSNANPPNQHHSSNRPPEDKRKNNKITLTPTSKIFEVEPEGG
jgi:hypothetical protein